MALVAYKTLISTLCSSCRSLCDS